MKTKFSGMAKVTTLCLPLALSFGLIACGDDSSSGPLVDKSASSRFGESYTAKATDDVWYGRLNDIDVVFEWDGNDAVRTFYQDMGSDSACVAMVESLCGEAPCVDDRNFTNSCDGSTLISVSYFVDDDKEIQFSNFMEDVCRFYFHSEEFLCKFDKTDNYWILDINDYGESFIEWDGNHFTSQTTSAVQSFKTNNECLEAADKMSEEDGMLVWCHDETLITETFVEGEVENRDEAFKKAKELCKISGDK